jgi:subfamily B ATP-binding cassette protein MsbA
MIHEKKIPSLAPAIKDLFYAFRLLFQNAKLAIIYIGVGIFYSFAHASHALIVKMTFDVMTGHPLPAWMPQYISGKQGERALVLILAMGFVLLIGKSIFLYVRRYLQIWLQQDIVINTRIRIAAHLLTLDLGFFQKKKTGEFISRLTNDLSQFRMTIEATCILLTRPITLISTVGTVLLINWRLALLGLIAVPPAAMILSLQYVKLREASKKVQEKRAELTNKMLQFISGISTIKTFSTEERERDQFRKYNLRLYKLIMQRAKARAQVQPIMEMVTGIGVLIVLFVGGGWVFSDKITVGDLIGFTTALTLVFLPARELSNAWSALNESLPAVDRVFEILTWQPSVRDGKNQIESFNDRIRFESVAFSYGGNHSVSVFKDINLTIQKGKHIAIVGPSGSGKSTLISLLLRFYDPTCGRITIDGQNLRDLTFESLHSLIAYVSQTPFLFNCSIKENIAYGAPNASQQEIEHAAGIANIHDTIIDLPDGYDTIAGEMGENLSGGQRQRIAIARALLRNSQILILDEATSALDAEGEIFVKDALEKSTQSLTSIVIAHRMATIRNADEILVLENGKITAKGRHEDLLKKSSTYANYVRLQIQ